MTDEQKEKMKNAPRNYLPSRAKAIKEKCWQCQGDGADPHMQWRIGNCECFSCGLYPVRPYQKTHYQKPIPDSLKKNKDDPYDDLGI